jgi:PAS domain S-box-containing protein
MNVDQEEHYLNAIFTQVPGAVWATDRDLKLVYAMGHVPAIPGIEAKRMLGRTIQDIIGTKDPTEPLIAHHLAALAGDKQSLAYNRRGRRFQMQLEPLRDAAGQIIGVAGVGVDITTCAQKEEALAVATRRLRDAQRVAHVGSFEWEIEPDVVTWSDELHRIYGIEPGTFGGTFSSFLERVHHDDLEFTKNVIFDAYRTHQPFTYDHRILLPDGTIRILHTRGDVVSDEHGKVVRMVGSCWDVTELRQATSRLERTISLLHAVIEATADGLLVVDREGAVAAQNQRFAALWRIPAELARRSDDSALREFVVDQLEEPDSFMRVTRELYDAPERESFDVLRFKDGRVFERYSIPQRVGDGVVGRVWSFRDVTEREGLFRRATFLADSSRLLASLDVESALDAVAHLTVPYLGDSCAVDLLRDGGPRRLLVVSRDSAHPAATTDLHPSVLRGHSSIDSAGGISHLAVPLVYKGAVLGAFTFIAPSSRRYSQRDIELAEELARRAALALENARLFRSTCDALQARDEFLSIAAHELRGPVTTIHLAVESLLRQKAAPRSTNKLLAAIERGDRSLSRFIDELLDVSQARSGKLRLDLETLDIAEVVRTAMSRLEPEIVKSGSALSITTEGRAVGHWDRTRLGQVVCNLLSNALKFGVGKPIEVSVVARDNHAMLVVRDHGMGIAPEMRERIFNPFERAVSSRNYGGLGLGLYVARTLVSGMGGTIEVESEPGKGTAFTVTLPLERSK